MNPISPAILLNMTESDTFDFKSGQYTFYAGSDEQKSELLKDIIAYANAWKTGDAFIVIGVLESAGRKNKVVGVTTPLKDNDIQQFVNSKTNKRVNFLVYSDKAEGLDINVIQIGRYQDRPICLIKGFGKLKANEAYIRVGSSTSIATPDQIAALVEADRTTAAGQPILLLECANTASRTRFGSSVRVHCGQITYAVTPPKPTPSTKPSLYDRLSPIDQLCRSFEVRYCQPTIGALSPYEPSPDEIRAFCKDLAAFGSINLWLKNTGLQNASNIKVEIVLPKVDGLQVVDRSDLPNKPTNYGAFLGDFHSPLRDTNVEGFRDHWRIRTIVDKIQPQDEYWSNSEFYMASSINKTLQGTATIFADNLTKPIEVSLTFHTVVEQKELPYNWLPNELE